MTAEFKFSCPACGQPVQADTRDCGSKVKCPACQADIVVPRPDTAPKPDFSMGGHAIPVPKHAHAAPRASDVVQPPPPPPRQPMCKLAVASFWLSVSSLVFMAVLVVGVVAASFWLSVLSLLLWPLGFIPGILCGRKAKAEIERNPSLGGWHLAQLGVITGYVFAAIFGAALVVTVILVYKPSKKPDPSVPLPAKLVAPVQPPTKETTAVSDTGWTLNLTNMTIPPWTVKGTVRRTEFKLDYASVGTNILIFRESTNATDMTVVIYLNQKPGMIPSGKKFIISPDSDPMLPIVRMGWWEDGKKVKQSASFTNGYALKLEFGNVTRNKVTGSNMLAGAIYLCLPDTNYSYLAGTFDARVIVPRPPVVPPGGKQSVPSVPKTKRTKKR